MSEEVSSPGGSFVRDPDCFPPPTTETTSEDGDKGTVGVKVLFRFRVVRVLCTRPSLSRTRNALSSPLTPGLPVVERESGVLYRAKGGSVVGSTVPDRGSPGV